MATPTNLPASFTSSVLTSSQMNNLRGAFRILQVVMGTTSTMVASASATLVDTGLSATITPQSSSSKILVAVNHAHCYKDTGNGFNCMTLTLVRAATTIQTFAVFSGFQGAAQTLYWNEGTLCLDSPATTSAVTYKTQFASQFGTSQVQVQSGSNVSSTIILMEVSA